MFPYGGLSDQDLNGGFCCPARHAQKMRISAAYCGRRDPSPGRPWRHPLSRGPGLRGGRRAAPLDLRETAAIVPLLALRLRRLRLLSASGLFSNPDAPAWSWMRYFLRTEGVGPPRLEPGGESRERPWQREGDQTNAPPKKLRETGAIVPMAQIEGRGPGGSRLSE